MSPSQAHKGAQLDARTLEQLMAYADGELAGAELVAVETLIAENPDAARVAEELGVLGECVRVAEVSSGAGFDVADAVMAKVAASSASVAPPARPASNPPRVAPVVDLASRRRRTFGVVAALVAAAAAVVIVARQSADVSPTTPVAVAPTAVAPPPSATVAAPVATALASNEAPKADTSDVGNVSVIVVPSDEEKTAPSVVIWLGGEEGSGGGIK